MLLRSEAVMQSPILSQYNKLKADHQSELIRLLVQEGMPWEFKADGSITFIYKKLNL